MGSRPGGRIHFFRVCFSNIFFGHYYYSATSTVSYFFTPYDASACSALIHIVQLSFSILYSLLLLCVYLSVFGNVAAIDVNSSTDEPELLFLLYSHSPNDVPPEPQGNVSIAVRPSKTNQRCVSQNLYIVVG